jgi:hypothetical protein
MFAAYPENLGLVPGDALRVDCSSEYCCCVEFSPVAVPAGNIYIETAPGIGQIVPIASVQVFDGRSIRRLVNTSVLDALIALEALAWPHLLYNGSATGETLRLTAGEVAISNARRAIAEAAEK